RSGLEDGPPGDAARGLRGVRLDRLRERIHRADLRAQVALVDQAGELGQLRAVGLLDEHDRADVVPGGRQRGVGTDRDQPSARLEQGGRAGEYVAADRVEDQVGAAGQ